MINDIGQMHVSKLRALLEETFSGNITPAEVIQLVRSYLEMDGRSLDDQLAKDNEATHAFKGIARELLQSIKLGNEKLDQFWIELIERYLKHGNQSLERYLSSTGAGSERFKEFAAWVKQNDILVLGMPAAIPHTEHREKKAQERTSIPGDWSLYTCQSVHSRENYGKPKHDGIINWVRVTLPKKNPPWYKPNANDIKTPLGWIRHYDHLAFSEEALRKYQFNPTYPNGINQPSVTPTLPPFKRVDLVTPARYDGVRFAPLAIYIGYEEEDSSTPLFYILEGGNAIGQAKVLYPSTTNIAAPILMHTGYTPTPFTSKDNYYLTHVAFDGMDPTFVSIKVYNEAELEAGVDQFHFEIQLAMQRSTMDQVASLDNFLPPAKQTLDALFRVIELGAMGVRRTKDDSSTKPTLGSRLKEDVEKVEHAILNPEEEIRDLLARFEKDDFSADDLKRLGHHAEQHETLLANILEQDARQGLGLGGSTMSSRAHQTWQNQLGNQVVQPLQLYQAKTLQGRKPDSLVSILSRALEQDCVVKPVGSGHSYSDVATTPDFFIDTFSLNHPSDSLRPIEGQLSQDMLRDGSLPLAIEAMDWGGQYDPENNRALFETESGIRLRDMNKVLYSREIGLANMGGYDGQTIIGAISTSTHGSGISLPPFPDMLRSLVMATTGRWEGDTVGGNPDGENGVYLYRIEPSNGITDPSKYQHDSIALIQDDDCFKSVICSMGCMGVIYSVVLEVMQMYWLEEKRYETTLDQVVDMLTSPEGQPGALPTKLQDVRNFEVLVHPYPMDGLKVLKMDPNEPAETYYPHFKCLVTERHIVGDPGTPGHRSGHRDFITQLASYFGLSFKITVALMNRFPRAIPLMINLAMGGLIDDQYINKYWKIYTLGLNENAGFAAEIGFSLEDTNGGYTQEHFVDAVNEIHRVAQKARLNGLQYQTSPFSLRFVKASEAHLSMMQGVNTCMIEMDMVTGTYGGNEVMMRYQNSMYALGGRPHWGLEFDHLTNNNGILNQMYPKLPEWLSVYRQFNAKGTFNNRFTDRMGFTHHDFIRE